MKKIYPTLAAVALAGIALTGCSQSAAPDQTAPTSPAETSGSDVAPGEPAPGKGTPFSPAAADQKAVQSAWEQLADACDRMDITRIGGGLGEQFVCDPRGAFEVTGTDLGEIQFRDEWAADGYVYWTAGSPTASGPDPYDDETVEQRLTGSLHPQSGTVTLVRTGM
ncbi:hypothetical protein [Leucobacter salsicius]|uniref:hypothetical protein n=1 Tax=Leucobacter salsicius TaxID=664638 RepID=UPI00034514CA|nr:hypothetical protein [Leucobacter salsicius]